METGYTVVIIRKTRGGYPQDRGKMHCKVEGVWSRANIEMEGMLGFNTLAS